MMDADYFKVENMNDVYYFRKINNQGCESVILITAKKAIPFFVGMVMILFYPPAGGLSEELISGQSQSRMPFEPGEKLMFDLRWSFIKAGQASLEVDSVKTINGRKAYHFVLKARSTPFLDLFYKIRDRIDAYADIKMTHSMLYTKKQREGKTHRDIVVRFDHNTRKAHYSNFNKKRHPIPIQPGTFDPLSIFYFSRLFDLRENQVLTRPVSDGKKCVIGEARVLRRETLDLSCGRFDTFLIEPDLKHVGGVFEKSREAKIQIWITADARRIPVRVKSKVAVGSFIGELISISDTKSIDGQGVDS